MMEALRRNGSLIKGGIMNGKRLYVIFGICSFIFLAASGYAEVKIRSINNEKKITETSGDIKEIKEDQTIMLIQQANLEKDISYLILMVEDLKRSN